MSVLITVSGAADFDYLRACVALSRAFVLVRHEPTASAKALDLANRLRETVSNVAQDVHVGALSPVWREETRLYGWSFGAVLKGVNLTPFQEAASVLDVDILVIDL